MAPLELSADEVINRALQSKPTDGSTSLSARSLARDIVDLYLNPPDKAMVLCVNEKTQIQALEWMV